MSRLKDRVAVVTGAAAGIGRAAAIRLAKEGARIEILDLKDSKAVCDEIRASGGTANSAVCDVTDEAQVQTAVDGIASRNARVDILVNNAGILSGRSPWHTLSKEEVNRFIQINYIGYFVVTKAVYPLIKKSATGRSHQRRFAHLLPGESRANGLRRQQGRRHGHDSRAREGTG